MYADDIGIYQQIIQLVANGWKELEDQGVDLPGSGIVFPIVVGNKGDWSYLVTKLQMNIANISKPFCVMCLQHNHHRFFHFPRAILGFTVYD